MSQTVLSVLGDKYTVLLTGEQTGGAYAVFDFWVPPGGGTPPHLHTREDEAFYVVEGEFEFTVAGEKHRRSAGEYIVGKRDIPHNFRNVGATPGRMVVTITPAGLEHFFAEIGARLPDRESPALPPDHGIIAQLPEIATRYGIQML